MIVDFNAGWRFCRTGQSFVPVNLPHDAMLTERRDPNCHNGKQSGYFPGGKYTYEKTFTIPQEQMGKSLCLLFEGVYQNCRVLLNGTEIASHKYGYTEFYVDISTAVREGENTLTVLVDNSLEPNCRWYSGSGIYRPVWLLVDELEQPSIVTKSIDPAMVEVSAPEGTAVEIWDGDKLIVSGTPGELTVPDATLWSAETPHLYTCVCRLGGKECRTTFGIRKLEWSAKEGLRVNGLRVLLRGGCIHHDNGVLGACGFADAEERRVRILKAAGYNAIRSAHNPMSRAMLDACDRLGMYVMDESFDGWYTPKNYHDYARYFADEWQNDVRAMVEKDFNHPCVIMYSVGNEVSETASERGVETCGQLVEFTHSLDATRPVTAGVNVLLNVYTQMGVGVYKDKGSYKAEPLPPKTKHYREKNTGSTFFNVMAQKLGGLMFFMSKGKKGDRASRGAGEKLDILGLNYAGSRIDDDVKNYPDRMMVASETMVTDLPYNWERVKKYPAMVGDFVWASWDYLGEAIVGDWAYHSYKGLPLLAGSGTIDITGKITAEAYYQQVVWGLRTIPYIGVQPLNHSGEVPDKSAWRFTNALDSWSWHGYEGKPAVVEVFADADAVRLELNGMVIGTNKLKDFRTKFKLPYQPGTLVAVALDETGKELSRHNLTTCGTPAKLTANPDKLVLKADGQSLCFLPIEFTDGKGELLPYTEQPVTVKVEGAAVLQGLGSALCKTDERYDSDTFTSFRGRVLAVIRAGTEPGNVNVTVTSAGVSPVKVQLQVR